MNRYIRRLLVPVLVLVLSALGVVGGAGVARATTDCGDSAVGVGGDFVMWEGSQGGWAQLPIMAAAPCLYARIYTFETFDITAKAGQDYVGVDSGQVVLPAGAKSTVIRIRILPDTSDEPPERFGVRLLDGGVFSDAEAIVTLVDR